ncbi:MAG: alpha/beta hydrolase [Catalinimonas sp.]
MSYVQTSDDCKLYVKQWGPEGGRPVVLIHGWPLSADSWDPIALALADAGFRTVAYDRRGFGRSEQPWGGYDYDTLADDLSAVLEATHATEDAALVGFSMGGGEVARYMSRHGGKGVRRAVLVSSVVPYLLQDDTNPDGAPRETFTGMIAGVKEDRPAFLATFFKNFYGVGFLSNPVSDAYLQWSRAVAMQGSLRATVACIESFGTTDFRPDLPHFKVPTLVIHGTKDDIVPISISGRPAAEGIAGATLIEYDGEPHGVFATSTSRLTEDLLSFLRA